MKKRNERRIKTITTPGLAFQIVAAAKPITTREALEAGKAAYETCVSSAATESNDAQIPRRRTHGKAK
jgi:hypothetical protein